MLKHLFCRRSQTDSVRMTEVQTAGKTWEEITLERSAFLSAREKAIKEEQIEKCYRQYLPPQIKFRIKSKK